MSPGALSALTEYTSELLSNSGLSSAVAVPVTFLPPALSRVLHLRSWRAMTLTMQEKSADTRQMAI